jgi:hypothetical protein
MTICVHFELHIGRTEKSATYLLLQASDFIRLLHTFQNEGSL